MNKIVILGRGISLKRLKELDECDNIDSIILVNEFWDCPYINNSYYKDPLIYNFIKNKKIILITTPACDYSNIQPFLKSFNIINKYKTNFSKRIRVGKNSVMSLLPDILIDKYIHLEKNHGFTGSLGVAIIYAIFILKTNNITIFGLDFYEKEYYISNNYSITKEQNKSDKIKEHWINFFKYYNNINFNIYTMANFNCDLSNVKLF